MLTIFKHLFRLQFLIILVAIFAGIYYPQILEKVKSVSLKYLANWIDRTQDQDRVDLKYNSEAEYAEKLFTKAELAMYNGEDEAPLYLALLGCVFDVTKGVKHYGSGCAYNFFVGRDASVSFITGEFETFDEQQAEDVNSLKPSDLLSLENWKGFYNKEYVYRGKLIGRFYDETGTKTKYHHQFDALVQQAKESKAEVERLREIYPDCNIEWSDETGTRVWCTTTSGGKERAWVGYPRKLFEIGSDSFRCACMRKEELQTKDVMIKPYDNCDEMSDSCYYTVD